MTNCLILEQIIIYAFIIIIPGIKLPVYGHVAVSVFGFIYIILRYNVDGLFGLLLYGLIP